jgi:hypothetical protein
MTQAYKPHSDELPRLRMEIEYPVQRLVTYHMTRWKELGNIIAKQIAAFFTAENAQEIIQAQVKDAIEHELRLIIRNQLLEKIKESIDKTFEEPKKEFFHEKVNPHEWVDCEYCHDDAIGHYIIDKKGTLCQLWLCAKCKENIK